MYLHFVALESVTLPVWPLVSDVLTVLIIAYEVALRSEGVSWIS